MLQPLLRCPPAISACFLRRRDADHFFRQLVSGVAAAELPPPANASPRPPIRSAAITPPLQDSRPVARRRLPPTPAATILLADAGCAVTSASCQRALPLRRCFRRACRSCRRRLRRRRLSRCCRCCCMAAAATHFPMPAPRRMLRHADISPRHADATMPALVAPLPLMPPTPRHAAIAALSMRATLLPDTTLAIVSLHSAATPAAAAAV